MDRLTEGQVKYLLGLEKVSDLSSGRAYPGMGGKLEIPLRSVDNKEEFVLNITKGRKNYLKVSHQTRARVSIPIARLDFGAKHTNPDSKIVGSPHLHIYREGYGDKWAYELDDLPDDIGFSIPPDNKIESWSKAFLDFCRIKGENTIDWRHPWLL